MCSDGTNQLGDGWPSGGIESRDAVCLVRASSQSVARAGVGGGAGVVADRVR